MIQALTRRFVKILRTIVRQNSHLNLRKVDLNDTRIAGQIRYHGIHSDEERVLEGMKAVQRLLRIVPSAENYLVWNLLDAGFSSALEIASMSRTAFVKELTAKSAIEKSRAEYIHKMATMKRSQLLPFIMNDIQNREPHIQSASF